MHKKEEEEDEDKNNNDYHDDYSHTHKHTQMNKLQREMMHVTLVVWSVTISLPTQLF